MNLIMWLATIGLHSVKYSCVGLR